MIELSNFHFGQAFQLLINGCKVQRQAWFDNNKWLILKNGLEYTSLAGLPYFDYTKIIYIGCIDKKSGLNKVKKVWIPTQEDILAKDWEVIDII